MHFHGAEVERQIRSSVLILQSQKAKIILFVFNMETAAYALAPCHGLAVGFCNAPAA